MAVPRVGAAVGGTAISFRGGEKKKRENEWSPSHGTTRVWAQLALAVGRPSEWAHPDIRIAERAGAHVLPHVCTLGMMCRPWS